MQRLLSFALAMFLAVASINVVYPSLIVGVAQAATYSVSLVRPDSTIAATNTYNNAADRDAQAAVWQSYIDSGQLPGYTVTKTNDYREPPIDPDQN